MVSATTRASPAAAARMDGCTFGCRGVEREHVPVQGPLGGARHADEEVDFFVGEHVVAAFGDCFERGARMASDLTAQRQHLLGGGHARRHGVAVAVGVRRRARGREPEAARGDAIGKQLGHGLDLGIGGRIHGALGPHDLAANRTVAHEETRVDRDLAVEHVEVFTEGGPAPVDALFERGERHAFDLGHHAPREVGVGLDDGCEGEAAVATDDRRDPVHVRRRCVRVPQQLRVVVGVRVDEAWAHDEPGSVDDPRGRVGDLADRGDATLADPDVADEARTTGSVDDGRAVDAYVEHVIPSQMRRAGTTPAMRGRASGGFHPSP
jgi:hypothetical protein